MFKYEIYSRISFSLFIRNSYLRRLAQQFLLNYFPNNCAYKPKIKTWTQKLNSHSRPLHLLNIARRSSIMETFNQADSWSHYAKFYLFLTCNLFYLVIEFVFDFIFVAISWKTPISCHIPLFIFYNKLLVISQHIFSSFTQTLQVWGLMRSFREIN